MKDKSTGLTNKELFEMVVVERGPYCEMCYWELAVDPHHCIVHRRKGHPEYDVPENIELLCRGCHSDGYVNSYQHRVGFWNKQVERGYDMIAWYDGLNLKTRENFG